MEVITRTGWIQLILPEGWAARVGPLSTYTGHISNRAAQTAGPGCPDGDRDRSPAVRLHQDQAAPPAALGWPGPCTASGGSPPLASVSEPAVRAQMRGAVGRQPKRKNVAVPAVRTSRGRHGPHFSSASLAFGPEQVPLSVLDLAPVPDGGNAGDALRATTDLARHAEELGFRRFWVAEHHNMPGIASSAPPVLIGHIADATTAIRVGSGGVMLPNHVSLVVAEQFGMLEALHPGRIDLGIGRAPGTDQVTAAALRRSPEALSADDFPDQLIELLGFFTGRWPEGHPFARITAVPGRDNRPAMWLLGSSGYSAQVAGCSASRSPSRTTSARPTPSRRWPCTARISARPRCSTGPTPWSPPRWSAPTPTSGRAGWPARGRCRS